MCRPLSDVILLTVVTDTEENKKYQLEAMIVFASVFFGNLETRSTLCQWT